MAAVLYASLSYHFTHGQGHLFLYAYYDLPLTALLLCWRLDGRLLPRRLNDLGEAGAPPRLTRARLRP